MIAEARSEVGLCKPLCSSGFRRQRHRESFTVAGLAACVGGGSALDRRVQQSGKKDVCYERTGPDLWRILRADGTDVRPLLRLKGLEDTAEERVEMLLKKRHAGRSTTVLATRC